MPTPADLPIGASASDAAAWLTDVVGGAGPYYRLRLEIARWYLSDGSVFADYWCGENARRAALNVGRMEWVRHKTVHTAMVTTPSAKQLSLAAYDIVDGTLEVLPRWFAQHPISWQAISAIRDRFVALRSEWHANGLAALDVDHLVDP